MDLTQVQVFRADWRPRLVAGVLTAAGALLLWVPLWPLAQALARPGVAGLRLGLGMAMCAACVELFRREARHRLEVGPLGLKVKRGRVERSFSWDQFDAVMRPGGALMLGTRDREFVTLQGWDRADALVPLVLGHVEQQLKGARPAAWPQALTRPTH
jgi:hypothetical protein